MAWDIFTPNPSRKANAYGALSRQRIERIRLELANLIKQSDQPISIYINSPGGKIDFISTFHDTLFSRKPNERALPLITIVREKAESSAAYLLILGDYSYAHTYSKLLLHGVGYFSLKKNLKIHREEAAAIVMRLDEKNRAIAQKLSRRVVRRLAFKHHLLAGESKGQSMPNRWVKQFVQSLQGRLRSEKNHTLMAEALTHFQSICPNLGSLHPSAKEQFSILRQWTTRRLRAQQKSGNTLDGAAALGLAIDLTHLSDFLSDEFLAQLPQLTESHGRYLLSPEETANHAQALKADPVKAKNNLQKIAGPRLLQLWCFSYALCWRLLIGENEVLPEDAYWMGLVDEVIDTGLTGERLA